MAQSVDEILRYHDLVVGRGRLFESVKRLASLEELPTNRRFVVCPGYESRGQRPMVVCVIAVNWKISAAVKKTRPSAISLKWRSSLPLAAKTNITNAAIMEMSASASMAR
jgi:hypothetical protein